MEDVFYNLKAEPFRLSPDHRFCYDHECYAKARAYMAYAFMRAEGFVMITGRPGTGKTTLIGELIDSLADENVKTANLVCTQLQADDLLKVAAYDFGVDHRIVEKGELLQHLSLLLRRWHREGSRALLIVDEAQDLSESAMEELRLLTNIQEDGKPLLQIFLLGQPELRELVLSPALEQVHQRIVAASHLDALEKDETEAYIIHRLNKVDWAGDPALSKAIFPLIHKFSEGVPRRINLICSRLFLHGTVEQRHQIGVADLRQVIEELQAENLAAGTQILAEDFEIEDEFEPPSAVDAPEPTASDTSSENESGISTPPQAASSHSSESGSPAEEEYLHAVGDDVVLEFDSANGTQITDEGGKKDDVIAFRQTPQESPAPVHHPQNKPTNEPVKPSPAFAKSRPEQPKASTADSKTSTARQNVGHNPDVAAPPPAAAGIAPEPSEQTENSRRIRSKHGVFSTVVLCFFALLLLVGAWLTYDRGLRSLEAWQNQLDEWRQSLGTFIQPSTPAEQPATRYGDSSLAQSATEPLTRSESTVEIAPKSEMRIEAESIAVPDSETEPAPQLEAQVLPEPEPEPDSAPQPQTNQPVASSETIPSPTVATEATAELGSMANPSKLEIVFDFDSAELSAKAKGSLEKIANNFLSSGSGVIRVTGYADKQGDSVYNIELSRRRANAVAQYLVVGGVDSGFLEVKGGGIFDATEADQEATTNSSISGRVVLLEVHIDKPAL